jgi:hypothetical protein
MTLIIGRDEKSPGAMRVADIVPGDEFRQTSQTFGMTR